MSDVSEDDAASPAGLVSWPRAFGERLRHAREAAGMSQGAVQEKLGYPIRSLTRWENGGADPGFEKVARMAECYGVSTDWIAGRTTIQKCIRPGFVLIDRSVLETLRTLAVARKTIADVPAGMIRRPGVAFAAVVPDDLDVVGAEAASAVEQQMRVLWKQLGGEA